MPMGKVFGPWNLYITMYNVFEMNDGILFGLACNKGVANAYQPIGISVYLIIINN